MKCVVTGAAGFIGSHLCQALLGSGHEVVGLDSFTSCYPEVVKQRNLLGFLSTSNCRFFRADLCKDSIDNLLGSAEVIFHLAGLAGLTRSWSDLDAYWANNVLATERLLQAAHRSAGQLRRFVLTSTASVYGTDAVGDEGAPTKPASPYAVTKLAAENLCLAYADAYQIPVVILRYFSVYGPRQRPDLDCHAFIQALLRDEPITVHGDGRRPHTHTFVGDCVSAALAATEAPPGEVYNVGGTEAASVWDVLSRLETLAGRPIKVRQQSARPGEQRPTLADTAKLHKAVGWEPRTGLAEGLDLQWAWQAREWKAGDVPAPVAQPPHSGARKGIVKK